MISLLPSGVFVVTYEQARMATATKKKHKRMRHNRMPDRMREDHRRMNEMRAQIRRNERPDPLSPKQACA